MCCGTKANEMDKGKLEKAVKFITFIKKGGGVGSEFCPNQKFFINCDTRGLEIYVKSLLVPSFIIFKSLSKYFTKKRLILVYEKNSG